MLSLFFACSETKSEDNETSAPQITGNSGDNILRKYTIDREESVITYKGFMLLASKGSMLLASKSAYEGYLYLSKGEWMTENDGLTGGTVEVDMNTITDKNHGSNNGLVRHLKSPDFFDVKKFPKAAFTITKVLPSAGSIIVTGNLTIKDITHPVTFPARMDIKNEVIQAEGTLSIDRTQWDIRYKSGKFFSDLADEVISDTIEFHMKVVAKKHTDNI